MAYKPYEKLITPEQKEIILAQKLFFVGTAGTEGTVNVSPRGHDTFRILNDKQVAWVDYHGSGNETYRHLSELNRITVMFCDFEGMKQIIRLFGKARSILPNDPDFQPTLDEMNFEFDPVIRQLFLVDIELTSNSCGSGVPVFSYLQEGTLVDKWRKRHEAGDFEKVTKRVSSLPRPVDVLNDPNYWENN